MSQLELNAKELARQVLELIKLGEEKKAAMADFKVREMTLKAEIFRLSMDVRSGQTSLFPSKDAEG